MKQSLASHEECKESDSRQDERPYKALGYCIVEQAVLDLKALMESGIITGGKVKEPWPLYADFRGRVKPQKFLGFYDSQNSVQALLDFFTTDHMPRLLAVLQSELHPSRVLKGLKLEVKKCSLNR